VVQRGDTLSGIARTLRVSVSDLRDWNDLSNKATIKPGQRLVAFVQRGT
jgi:membrane-bound lytic murein transglycosylase D